MNIEGMKADIFFGNVDGERQPADWRASADDEDPDDEELEKTPADVVALLGFDPKEL